MKRFFAFDDAMNIQAATEEDFRSAVFDVEYTIGPGGVAVLDFVYVSGPDQVDKINPLFENKMPAIGVVSYLLGGGKCLVRTGSLLTGFVGLLPNSTYWGDPTTPGGITPVAPDTTARVIQEVAYAIKSDTLMVEIDRDFTINPLI